MWGVVSARLLGVGGGVRFRGKQEICPRGFETNTWALTPAKQRHGCLALARDTQYLTIDLACALLLTFNPQPSTLNHQRPSRPGSCLPC